MSRGVDVSIEVGQQGPYIPLRQGAVNVFNGKRRNDGSIGPSLAIFVRGTHEVGTFVELLAQHQRETENKAEKNKFWILHVCIFRLGHVTSGETVGPTSDTD